MSTVNAADLTRLAHVDSANDFEVLFMGGPELLLDVAAQRSGFNWELRIQPGLPEIVPIPLEYYPYLVLETMTGPGWPKNAGIGPVVPPTSLQIVATHVGSKGIEVIGKGFNKKLDFPKA